VTVPSDLIAQLKALAPEQREMALRAAGETHVKEVDHLWPIWTHEGQLPPHDDWDVWVIMAGRGFGKTRAGAEWVAERARETPGAKIALVAATPAEARRVMIEGRGGLFAAARDGEERAGMRWEPGLGRLTFASGAQAFTFSGADGESLRGPEHHFAWCDELAKWKKAQATWDNLLLGLRAGARPRVLVTTTPRSVPALRAVLAMENVLRTGGASRDNPHVAESSLRMVERLHGGTRFGRQELLGELIEDVEGALWPRALIEKSRAERMNRDSPSFPINRDSPSFSESTAPSSAIRREKEGLSLFFGRVVIGVDPPASAAGDACGIVACGLGADGIAYVLGDHSAGGLSPEQWARKVAGAAEKWRADRIVAEGNQGGEMVEAVLRGAGLRLPVKRVHARVGKAARAEPIAAFFESGEAKFAGRFPALEDELAGLVIGGDYQGPGRSPDRADAMVWALTELLLGAPPAAPRVRGF
jgi:phage terminase large subunit-like protein